MAIAIANALILADADDTPRPGAILVEGRHIAGVAYGAAEAAALVARAREVHDANGAVAMPALVNAHHHSYGNLLRGTENDLPLELWALFTVAWGRALDAALLRLAILAGAAEMLRAGYAAVVDHAPQLDCARRRSRPIASPACASPMRRCCTIATTMTFSASTCRRI